MGGSLRAERRRWRSAPLASIAILIGVSAAASAETVGLQDYADMSIEELLAVDLQVGTATRTQEVGVEEAPAAVEVITAEELRRRGYRTVGEALAAVAGFSMVDDHVYQRIGVRGVFAESETPNDIVKVMINGQPVSFRPTGAHFVGEELIPLDAISRIEVVKGPASSLYGANAFLGVINIITREPFSDSTSEPVYEGTVETFHTAANDRANFSASLAMSDRVGDFGYLVAISGTRADRSGLEIPGLADIAQADAHRREPTVYEPAQGFPSPGHTLLGRAYLLNNAVSDDDTATAASAYAMAGYRLSDAVTVSIDGNAQYMDRAAEFQEWAPLTHATRLSYLNGYGRLTLSYGREGGLTGKARVALSGGAPTSRDTIADPLVTGVRKRRLFGYRAIDTSLELGYPLTDNTSVGAGFDYTADREDLLSLRVTNLASGTSTEEAGFSDRTFSNVGAFAHVWTRPWSSLVRIAASARLEHNTVIACDAQAWDCLGSLDDSMVTGPGGREYLLDERGAVQLSSRLAAIVDIPRTPLRVKLMYGSSFKPPSPFELFHERVVVAASQGNPALKAQTADTFEAMIGARFDERLDLGVTAFYTLVDDKVHFLPEDGDIIGRNGDLEAAGLEAEVRFAAADNLAGFVNGTFLAHHRLRLQQGRGEPDTHWQFSDYNGEFEPGMFPRFLLNAGINAHAPAAHLNLNLELRYVGERRASLSSSASFSPLDVSDSYFVDPYISTNLTVSTIGIQLLGERETVFSLSVRDAPGRYVQPGFRGVDIPTLGPRVYVQARQAF